MKAERETKPWPPLLLEQNLALDYILLKDEPCHLSWSRIPRFTLRLPTPTPPRPTRPNGCHRLWLDTVFRR